MSSFFLFYLLGETVGPEVGFPLILLSRKTILPDLLMTYVLNSSKTYFSGSFGEYHRTSWNDF